MPPQTTCFESPFHLAFQYIRPRSRHKRKAIMKSILFRSNLAALAALCFGAAALAQQPVTIAISIVGNPGNAADSATGSLYGNVEYTYGIGTYDVTLTQYTAFLNAVARTDTYSLFNGNQAMDTSIAGIQRSGSSGNYTYSLLGDGQRPVTYVSWLDAARFCNWLHNGQPTSGEEDTTTTESGAYALNGDMTGGLETKSTSATWWIPSENEWYKAAYYDPSLNSGQGGYWAYATKSNTAPGNSWANRTLANEANYYHSGYTLPGPSQLTDVGAFTNSASAYGTYDQAGNVFNWNDAVISGSNRGARGGPWNFSSSYLRSSSRTYQNPTSQFNSLGFRVATSVLLTPWLIANGLTSNTDLRSTSTATGLPLLLAYALQLDPNKNQRSRIPNPVVSGSTVSLIFYGRNSDITYSAQISTDLKAWTTTGVTVSPPDANGLCTATALTSGSSRLYMRLQVTY